MIHIHSYLVRLKFMCTYYSGIVDTQTAPVPIINAHMNEWRFCYAHTKYSHAKLENRLPLLFMQAAKKLF